MGELFERPLPARTPDWPGERLTSAGSGQIDVERLHLYFMARSYCRGVDVLDLAAGEGHGTALLAPVARSVVGLEIGIEAVDHAKLCYKLPNLRYEAGYAHAIPLPDASVDRVVSFETIEYLFERQVFLAEVRRVLRPGGLLICSWPDRDFDSPQSSVPTPQHVGRTKNEFEHLLSEGFAHVQLIAQRSIVGSVLVPADEGVASRVITFDRRGATRFEMSDGVLSPLYWVAVASDVLLQPPVQSYYFESVALDEAIGAPVLARRCRALRAHIDKQQTQREAFVAELVACRGRLKEAEYHLGRLDRYIWTRIGLFVDRLLSYPAKLLDIYKPAAFALRAVPLPKSINLPPVVSKPDVSIVILSCGHCDYTLRCLASIAALGGTSTFEVILSDDCSKAPGLMDIAQMTNLRFIEPPSNLGFLRHANWAVAHASGKFVCLLNNDTELRAGAIDTLREIAEAYPEAGLIGSKLVYPDGRLQEAGVIIWDDGSASHYGRSDDPERPEYNYVRDVDCVSGVSILMPRKVWDELEGFDERYTPAYCAEADFAFRVRERGLRVLYAPQSVVVHHSSVGLVTDQEGGLETYRIRNAQTLKQRWAEVLEARNLPHGTNLMRARDSARNRRIVLVVDECVPEVDRDAGSRNTMEIIRSLQIGGAIVKFWPDNLQASQPHTVKLQTMGVEVFHRPHNESFFDWLQANADQLDLVFLNRPTIAPRYIATLKLVAPALPCAFYGHDLHGERLRAQAKVTGDTAILAEAEEMERIEREIWREVDVVTYPSIAEIQFVQATEPEVVARVIQPYCFDHFPAERTPVATQHILFVGGFSHSPNVDAALWFAHDVFPLVVAQMPEARLIIAGSNPVSKVVALERENIKVTGSLSSQALAELYETARVAVVPLRFGAGVKFKVVEALHAALPLVTTTVGAQGIEGLDAAAIVVDEPQDFADAITRLLRDDAQWIEQSNRQRQLAEASFSRERSVRNMLDVVEITLKQARAWEG